ncbi:MAG: hypothetical protein HYV27_12850 [Candidatus Hydrogenedentes bacterium]|nr:hypothetical protein [Candidatus Hydrogenedentota bacterium]
MSLSKLTAVALTALFTLSGCIPKPEVPPVVDLQTQQILAGMNNLEGRELTFQPDESASYYSRIVEQNVTEFMFDPDLGTEIVFGVNDPFPIDLGAALARFYGEDYSSVFVSSNGWVSFGEAGNDPADLTTHFLVPQISALPVDGTDVDARVSFQQTAEALVVTFENAPFDAISKQEAVTNSFQIVVNIPDVPTSVPEQIIISYLTVDTMASGIVGLSNGQTGNLTGDALTRFLTDFEDSDLEETNLNTPPVS